MATYRSRLPFELGSLESDSDLGRPSVCNNQVLLLTPAILLIDITLKRVIQAARDLRIVSHTFIFESI